MRDYAGASTTHVATRRNTNGTERRAMGIHWTDLLIISVVALLIFGPKRLPEMGSAIGKTDKEFTAALGDRRSGRPPCKRKAQYTSSGDDGQTRGLRSPRNLTQAPTPRLSVALERCGPTN